MTPRLEHWVKFAKPLLDLAIVITGVTVAFLLNNWNTLKSEEAERKKVLTSLQAELQEMCNYFPHMAAYQVRMSHAWDSLHKAGSLSDFHHYYYLQPQYNYSVIEYAMNTRNSAVVNFELHEKLLQLYKHIKMLEEAEVYMTHLALDYRPVDDENQALMDANLFLFDRFIGFSRNRASILSEANRVASQLLIMVNKEMIKD